MNPLLPQTEDEQKESLRSTHLFFLLCLSLVAGFVAWAWYGRLDVVSTATGEVIPSSQVKHVQHLEGGIVRQILVREGEEVTKGQPIANLEPTSSTANVDELQVRITALRADIARLEAEAASAETPVFPMEMRRDQPHLVQETLAMFATRKSRINNQLAGQEEIVIQRTQEAEEITSRIGNTQSRLKLLNEQVKISDGLMLDQLTNRMQHLELLKEVNILKGKITDDRSALRRAKAGMKGASNKLEAIRDSFNEKVREELEKKRRSYEEFTNRVLKFEDSLRRTVLRSPVDGVIKSLYIVTVGGVITPGSTVADVVPAGDKLIIEAKLPPQDIGYVHPGQEALITLASADANRFGNLNGEVIHVSPDTIISEDGLPFYKVRLATDKAYFEKHATRYNLVPGVQVMASIRTGQRSVMSYLIDPFLGSANQALRER